MLISYVTKLRSRPLISSPLLGLFISYLHTSTLFRYAKPINWNITHSFVRNNPLLSLLERCKSLHQLKQIQGQMVLIGLVDDSFAASRLIAFCALSESRSLEYCMKVLYHTQEPNVFSWNVTMRGHVESGDIEGAILLYKRMLRCGSLKPDSHTYPLLLKACSCPSLNCVGLTILGHVLKFGFQFYLFVHNASISMLLSYGHLEAAYDMFNKGCVRDLVTWNSIITGFVRRGLVNEAVKLYREMEAEKVKPDEITMIGVVSSCSQLQDLNLGREFHRYIEEHGIELTVPLTNALMDMYVKCGDLLAARFLFDNMAQKSLVSWTTMVLGYSRFGFLDVARELLFKIPEKSVVPWNAIISGCVHAKQSKEALNLFHEMQINSIEPDKVTMVNCLCACSQLGALDVGIWIHHYIEKHNLSLDVAMGTALVDMYAKCGNIAKAVQVFEEIPQRNCLTWTSIICGLALHGNARDALSYFSKMINIGLIPDEITFLGVLSACCHGGLVEEGRKYFSQMSSKFNISPKLKHYSCMVDLLGRAGHLEEAEDLIKNIPMAPDAAVLGALFFACRVHGNVLIGERTAFKLLEVDPQDSGNYVLLASMYSEAKMWKEARSARKMMEDRGVEKTPGCSSIEINGIVHEFIVRDASHPLSERIYECLVSLAKQLELLGFTSNVPAYGDDLLS
ncbi:PREDICTED: pentatricopeptide repeat-containing protein At2g22410, mitochondrial [Lupinus angustifolius]|nr:PREDICTED: pentatricopeptide repeat-containing protein At2g22410, mitochondrial [Lupinus angustifolius]XP_019447179.1 PREDICTED: pentatricopeptide repeat-containing protein At2g22410, mitochondrial [Lupinus angustifolius]